MHTEPGSDKNPIAIPGPPRATAVPRSLCEAEDGEWPVHGPAGPPGGFGDIGAAGEAEGADGQVSQGCHDPWPGSGSDLRLVFLVKGVAEPVQRFDGPLPADMGGQGGRTETVPPSASDTQRGQLSQ